MSKRIFFISLSLVMALITFAQSRYIDSLEQKLKTNLPDSVRYEVYDYLLYEYIHNSVDFNKGIKGSEDLLAFGKKTGNRFYIASAYNYLGLAYQGKGDLNKSEEYLLQSIGLFDNKKDAPALAASYANIAETYRIKGDYPNALSYNLRALKIREERKDSSRLATSYSNTGSIYHQQNNVEKALEYYLKALNIRLRQGKKISIAMSYNNIGLLYQDIAQKLIPANQEKAEQNYNLALEYYLKALRIVEEENSLQGKGILYNNIGNIYHLRARNKKNDADYKLAMDFYEKGLKIRIEMGDAASEAMTLNNIGNIYVERGDYLKGIELLEKSLELSKKINYREVIRAVYNDLSYVYKQKGDYKKSYEYLLLYSNIKDTMLNEENMKSMAQMQALYDSEKKDKQLLKKDAELAKKKCFNRRTGRKRETTDHHYFILCNCPDNSCHFQCIAH